MSKFSDKIIMIQAEDLPALAAHLVDLMQKNPNLIKDEQYLKPVHLSKEINIGQDRIKTAIRKGYYGRVLKGEVNDRYYATVTEARAYHFDGKKTLPPKK